MKKLFYLLILTIILGVVYKYRNNIVNFIMKNFIDNEEVKLEEPNKYYKNIDYNFVQNTENLYPTNKQEILNIIYTTLNRGLNEVIFYCDNNYKECIEDVNKIAEDTEALSTINNLVHPFNSYKNIYFSISSYGKITINIKKIYSEAEILLINNKIDQITNEIFYNGITDYDKIKKFHDYIINNTIYDNNVDIFNQQYIQTNSNTAVGLLFENKAICSGYSDTMAIFLSNIGFNNYKISSDEHIWNLVNYDNLWLHIDATWDDPVTSNGSNILIDDFFLIDSNSLIQRENELNKNSHDFKKEYYQEAIQN
ncbi:MAG: hypothetical protein J6D28_00695 [Bacilli bacterium]|nr:hypothetical protein [Bacilli bacterium]